MGSIDIQIHEVDDPVWASVESELGFDPYCSRGLRAVTGRALGHRPVLLGATGDGWRGWYAIDLIDAGGDRVLARTPEYGGPWLLTDGDPAPAAVALRTALDEGLRSLRAVSEVALLSAWVPHREAVAAAWQASADKELGVVDLRLLEERWSTLSKGRRSDVNRARRDAEIRWQPLDRSGAERFARPYAQAMEAKQAPDRWRLDLDYFVALADEPTADVHLSEVEGPDGAAMGLFLRCGARAAYLYATRWGDVAGGASAVVWSAAEQLAAAGTQELLLGGGLAHGDDDPLFRFKRSFATWTTPLLLSARTFDPDGHAAAVAAGTARPLPDGAVVA